MLTFIFVLSVLVLLISQTVMWRFLVNRGVKVPFVFAGTPGYLDSLFLKWCVTNNRPLGLIVVVRALSIIGALVSAFYTNWND